jgi:predicted ATP-dependent endonuclease of OLD family
MIKSIDFVHYRKIQDITLDFKAGVNAISGENGTCKSSILHVIGNSYQKIKQTNTEVDTKLLNVIKNINQTLNPKIESLTKGDKEYNDPAKGVKGKLYTVEYDDYFCDFRRHNAQGSESRYRLIPTYPKGEKQSLEERAVIYLGLTRILPIGELDDTTQIIRNNLPIEYQNKIIEQYEKLIGIEIDNIGTEKSNGIKVRSNFTTPHEGIDSNTISAGEDNVFIILTALICLEWLHEETGFGSTLLIDEIDATLHPSLQYKLVSLIEKYAVKYNIQVFCTTHSLFLLEKLLKNKQNVLYLTNHTNNTIRLMDKPDIYRINMFLKSETRKEALSDKKIAIFTEDAEARILLVEIFNNLSEVDSDFAKIHNYFHLVDINLGSDNLRDLFKDRFLNKTTLKSICILDGDKTDTNQNKDGRILSLPEDGSPEQIVFKHLIALYNNTTLSENFWEQHQVEMEGFNIYWLRDKDLITDVTQQINEYDREKSKKLFNKYQDFFILVFRHWLLKNQEAPLYKKFLRSLHIAFKATATENGINPNTWNLAKPSN